MALSQKTKKGFTYADYLTWPDDERWELINGEAYNMTPAPTTRHQNIVYNVSFILKSKLLNKSCRPFVAPTDVVLSEYDVVQPDVFVVCDEKKITEANIQGAPDLIVEVLSPATALKDKREKKNLYEKYGVKEYIIVDPAAQYVERFLLEEGGLYVKSEIFGPKEVLPLVSLKEIEIPLWEIFEVEEPKDQEKKEQCIPNG
ncbi:MAG: Uma2 family endonuclease [Desulfobacterales bacterium]|jgi:Uma2 family endonuclease|nr:Uma2 family endonuclease [Desulfobacterales bacterium]